MDSNGLLFTCWNSQILIKTGMSEKKHLLSLCEHISFFGSRNTFNFATRFSLSNLAPFLYFSTHCSQSIWSSLLRPGCYCCVPCNFYIINVFKQDEVWKKVNTQQYSYEDLTRICTRCSYKENVMSTYEDSRV